METLQRTANRGSISTGYDIDNSLKLEEANLECINMPASYTSITVSNVYKGTTSFWIKRTSLNNGSGVQWIFNGSNSARYDGIYWDVNDKLKGYFSALGNGADFVTTQVFRDTSAWYHIVMAIDTSLSTASERIKIYVNGEQITAWDTSPSIDQNTQLTSLGTDAYHGWGTSYSYNLGVSSDGSSEYLANCIHIDGQQLTSTDFGEFDEDSGIWKPKAYTGTYGNKGYLLEFQSSSALGTDTSGNGNNFTNNRNITSADQATDTPTNNFATFNPLLPNSSEKEGATVFINPDAGADTNLSTIAVANGKWYAEFKASSNISGDNGMVGVAANSGDSIAGRFLGQDAWSVGLLTNGSYYINSSATSYLGTTFNQDIISVALDMDNKKVYFAKNGTWGNSGNPATGTNGIALPSAYEDYEWFIGTSLVLSTATYDGNYGGYTVISISSGNADSSGYGTFEYAPPSGYYALCTKNLAEYG